MLNASKLFKVFSFISLGLISLVVFLLLFAKVAEFISYRSQGYDTLEQYLEAKKAGYNTKWAYDESKRIAKLKAEKEANMTEAQRLELAKRKEREDLELRAMGRGFLTVEDYQQALAEGFETKAEQDAAREADKPKTPEEDEPWYSYNNTERRTKAKLSCEKLVKPQLTHPSSYNRPFFDENQIIEEDGLKAVTFKFKAKNSFNLEMEFRVACSVDENSEAIDIIYLKEIG